MSWLSRHTRTACNSNLVSSFRAPHLFLVIVFFHLMRHAKCLYFVWAKKIVLLVMSHKILAQYWKVGNKFRIYQELYVLDCRLTCFPLSLFWLHFVIGDQVLCGWMWKCWWCDEMSTYGNERKSLAVSLCRVFCSSWREIFMVVHALKLSCRHRYVYNFYI